MLLFITKNKLIYGINDLLDKTQAQEYLNNHCIWVENMTPPIPEPQENKTLEMYLNEDNTIEYIFNDISPITQEIPELTQIEQAILTTAIHTEYIACMIELQQGEII